MRGIEFIACEWDFPGIDKLTAISGLSLLTCLRDPYQRLLSNYSSQGGDKYWGHISQWYETATLTWKRKSDQTFPTSYNLRNYYVRMLTGYGTQPDVEIGAEHLDAARKALDAFDLVLILERPESFELLGRLGVTGPLLHKNRRSRKQTRPVEEFHQRFIEENALDYALYAHGQQCCESLLKQDQS